MKKLLKTILIVMLVSALALTVTSCGNKEDKSSSQSDEGNFKKDKKDSKEMAEDTVDGFMQALCVFDIKEMSSYTLDPDAVKEEIGFDDLKTYVTEEIYAGSTDEEIKMMESFVDTIIDAYLEAIYDTMSYKITSSKKGGKDYVITTDFTFLDFELAQENLESTMNTEMASASAEVTNELIADGKITATTTEEEMIKIVFDAIAEKMVPIIEKSILEAPRTTGENTFLVTEKDGIWYIDTDKSKLSDAFNFDKQEK